MTFFGFDQHPRPTSLDGPPRALQHAVLMSFDIDLDEADIAAIDLVERPRLHGNVAAQRRLGSKVVRQRREARDRRAVDHRDVKQGPAGLVGQGDILDDDLSPEFLRQQLGKPREPARRHRRARNAASWHEDRCRRWRRHRSNPDPGGRDASPCTTRSRRIARNRVARTRRPLARARRCSSRPWPIASRPAFSMALWTTARNHDSINVHCGRLPTAPAIAGARQ